MARRPASWDGPEHRRVGSRTWDDRDFELFVANVLRSRGILIEDVSHCGGTYDFETVYGRIDAKYSPKWDGSGSVGSFAQLHRYVHDEVWFITNSLRVISSYAVRAGCRDPRFDYAIETDKGEIAFVGASTLDEWIVAMKAVKGDFDDSDRRRGDLVLAEDRLEP